MEYHAILWNVWSYLLSLGAFYFYYSGCAELDSGYPEFDSLIVLIMIRYFVNRQVPLRQEHPSRILHVAICSEIFSLSHLKRPHIYIFFLKKSIQ